MSYPQCCIIFTYHTSLGFSCVWQFLWLALILITLTVLKSKGEIFYEYLSTDIYLMFFLFLWLDCVMFGEKEHKDRMLFSSHTDEVVFVRFLHSNLFPFWPFFMLEWWVCISFLRAEYLYKFIGLFYIGGLILLPTYLLIQLLIYVSIDSWVFVLYFGL